jgi:DNA-3-methyladenine glycosylase II
MSPASPRTFAVTPRGPVSLTASIRFVEGFAPAAIAKQSPARLSMSFCVEGTCSPVAVEVWQDDQSIVGQYVGDAAPDIVADNVARILSADINCGGFAAMGHRDPVVRRLQERYPGLRPVCFWSPYEAAVWTILSQRVRIVQAAAVKQRIAQDFGQTLELSGQRLAAFPGPDRLATVIASTPSRQRISA